MDWIFESQYVVFSGGGVRALAFLGAYAVYQKEWHQRHPDRQLYDHLLGFAGSSAGAMMSLLCSLNCTPEQMMQECLKLDGARILQRLDVISVMDNWGAHDKKEIIQRLRHVLAQYGGNADVTFRELHQLTHKKLIVTATRVNDGTVQYMGVDTTPDLEVWRAVVSSMSIPLVFEPNRIGADLLVDGGILHNLPLTLYPIEKTTAFLLTRTLPYQVQGFRDYLTRLMYLAVDAMEREHLKKLPPEHRHRVIPIDTGNISSVDFSLDDQAKLRLVMRGAVKMHQMFHPHDLLSQARQWLLQSMFVNLTHDSPEKTTDGDKTVTESQ